MTNEFKVKKYKDATVYTLESASAGATGAGAIATASSSIGGVRRRDNLIAQESDTIKVPVTQKPRQGPLRPQTGAGQHRDKKKEQKQGKEKHRKPYMEELKTRLAALKNKLGENSELAQQMMALARSRGMNPRIAGTPEQERERTQQMMAQRAKDREEKDRQSASDDAAKLPELKAEYDALFKKYNSLGGRNWQYADREQNLSDSEREARSIEPKLNQLAGRIARAEKSQGVAEGAEFGAYYSEQVAQQIFNKRQDITSEDEVLNQAYHIVADEQGQRRARYMFNYDEDFPSDVVSNYFHLQKQGVAEGDAYFTHLENMLNEDWQKVNRRDKTDGMSRKAVKAYRRENPGSKLKTAVTTKPSKLKKGGKAAKRRKSFCARMKGMKKAHASAKTKRNPDSPINKALRRWNCEEDAYMNSLNQQVLEKLNPQADVDVWVQDFQKADPNKYKQFKNKTPQKKAQMAVAAHYAANEPSKKK